MSKQTNNQPEQNVAEKVKDVSLCKGIVKAVTSGNRIIVREPQSKSGRIPLEKVVVFSNVTCPELARMKPETQDDKGAWEAKEFTRKLLIGKLVIFSIEFEFPSEQVAGNVWLENEEPGKDQGIIEKGLYAGFFSVNEKHFSTPQNFKDLMLDAKNNCRGLYDSSFNFVDRDVTFKLTDSETFDLVKKYQKKKLPCQVEFVMSGSSIKVYLTELETYVSIILTGVRANSTNPNQNSRTEPDTRYAAEAKLFVETRVLNKDLEVILDYADPVESILAGRTSRITGTLIHPKGNISELLLSEGLAKCADWSIKYYTAGPVDKLRNAQNLAKKNRKRLWQDWKAPTEDLGQVANFAAIVKQIVHTDTVIVRKTENSEDIKITFSSTRALNKSDFPEKWKSKIANIEDEKIKTKTMFSPILDMPVNFEAKEFLRKKLIGKRVKINIDYKQEKRTIEQTNERRGITYPERLCATVSLGDTNIAEAMISRGYIKCISHGASDDKRSSQYDNLMLAEQKAIAGKKGIYNTSNLSLPRVMEISGKERSAPFFTQYQRQDKVPAIVDHIFSASRLKCYIPKDNINVMVIMAGIEAPKMGQLKNGVRITPNEKYAEEALKLVKDKIMQMEVALNVVSQDKYGTFVAYVYDTKMDNLSISLVNEGLAKMHWSAERTNCYSLLSDSETKAKEARKNIWTNYTPEDDIEEEITESNNNNTNQKLKEPTSALISHVPFPLEGDNNVYISIQSDEAEAKLTKIQTELNNQMRTNPPLSGSIRPKRNEIIAAKWPLDDSWYRAKVEKLADKSVKVNFIDFGNSDTFEYLDRVGRLPATVDLSTFPGQSKNVKLAFVEYPKNDEYRQQVYNGISDSLLDHKVKVQEQYNKKGVENVTISEDGKDNVSLIIKDGYLMAAETCPEFFKKLLGDYKNMEKEALKSHVGIWRFGDIRDDGL